MIMTRNSRLSGSRRFQACLCLLALALLWTPLWAAALQANGMACCDGLMCAVHGHSKANHVVSSAAAQQAPQPMHCEHSGTSPHSGSIAGCLLSCCQQQSPTFMASILFVIPAPQMIADDREVIGFGRAAELPPYLHSRDILSPPPRNS